MNYVSIIFCAFAFYIVMLHLNDIKKQLEASRREAKQRHEELVNLIIQLCEFQDNYGDTYTSDMDSASNALTEICVALNQEMGTSNAFIHYSVNAFQHILICLRPFVDNSLNEAVEREDYEAAHKCQVILDNLDRMINVEMPTSSQNDNITETDSDDED